MSTSQEGWPTKRRDHCHSLTSSEWKRRKNRCLTGLPGKPCCTTSSPSRATLSSVWLDTRPWGEMTEQTSMTSPRRTSSTPDSLKRLSSICNKTPDLAVGVSCWSLGSEFVCFCVCVVVLLCLCVNLCLYACMFLSVVCVFCLCVLFVSFVCVYVCVFMCVCLCLFLCLINKILLLLF